MHGSHESKTAEGSFLYCKKCLKAQGENPHPEKERDEWTIANNIDIIIPKTEVQASKETSQMNPKDESKSNAGSEVHSPQERNEFATTTTTVHRLLDTVHVYRCHPLSMLILVFSSIV